MASDSFPRQRGGIWMFSMSNVWTIYGCAVTKSEITILNGKAKLFVWIIDIEKWSTRCWKVSNDLEQQKVTFVNQQRNKVKSFNFWNLINRLFSCLQIDFEF